MNVLTVWETRNVFGSEYVNALRGALFAEQRKQLEQCIQVIISKPFGYYFRFVVNTTKIYRSNKVRL